MSLPTLLLIPGAFTEPTCYNTLIPYLKNSGFPVQTAPLITCNPANQDPKTCTAEQQGIDLLDNHLRPLIETQEKDVVVFAHSFGATSCSGAGSGLKKTEREKEGNKGGILGIVYIAGVLCKDGEYQLTYMGGTWPPDSLNTPSPGLFTFTDPVNMLWNDLTPLEQQKLLPSHLPHATSVFETPAYKPLWSDEGLEGRRVYILTKRDQALPAEAQRAWLEGCGVNWEVKEVDAGHAAFISRAEEVAGIVEGAVGGWM